MTKSKISLYALILLIVSAVDSNRDLPSAAIFGAPLIFFFLFGAIFFLFPVSIVSGALGTLSEKRGGIYHWIRHAFGEKVGVIAIWLQWINAVTWFPTILTFIGGTAAYLFNPELIENKIYMVFAISIVFWGLTIVNLFGIHVSAKINEIFCIIGTLIPAAALVILGFIWMIRGEPFAISITPSSIIPSFKDIGPWTALVAIITAYTGMELASVHMHSIKNPIKAFPKALMIGSLIVLFTLLCGSLSIAIVLPSHSIHLAGGLMQVFAAFFDRFHLGGWIVIVSLMVLIGSLGNLINWIVSPAKGLLHASEHGYIPAFLSYVNKKGVATRILIGQAILVTLFCLLFLLLPSVNAFYWFLMAISSSLYMMMYVMMFCAAIHVRHQFPQLAYHGRFGKFGLWFHCALGLIGCLITIVVTFIPPPGISIAPPLQYFLMMLIGNLVLISPAFLLLKKRA